MFCPDEGKAVRGAIDKQGGEAMRLVLVTRRRCGRVESWHFGRSYRKLDNFHHERMLSRRSQDCPKPGRSRGRGGENASSWPFRY